VCVKYNNDIAQGDTYFNKFIIVQLSNMTMSALGPTLPCFSVAEEIDVIGMYWSSQPVSNSTSICFHCQKHA
jgi:hypothetical protein